LKRNSTINKDDEKVSAIEKHLHKADKKEKKNNIIKNRNLLSFMEDEDDEPVHIKTKKFKSSHDMLNDPKLSKDHAIDMKELENKRRKRELKDERKQQLKDRVRDKINIIKENNDDEIPAINNEEINYNHELALDKKTTLEKPNSKIINLDEEKFKDNLKIHNPKAKSSSSSDNESSSNSEDSDKEKESKAQKEEYKNLLKFNKSKIGSKLDDTIEESMQSNNVSLPIIIHLSCIY